MLTGEDDVVEERKGSRGLCRPLALFERRVERDETFWISQPCVAAMLEG
jgi:hypothetical protein